MDSQKPRRTLTDVLGASAIAQPMFAVSEHKRSGLILCKTHHAEFAGPGAVFCSVSEQSCTTIIAIGAPELVPVVTHAERQKAFSRRIQWTRWLEKITHHQDPMQRVDKLFSSFEAFFDTQVLLGLPDELLAKLAGVLPQTIATARWQYAPLGQPDDQKVSYKLQPIDAIASMPALSLVSQRGASIAVSPRFLGLHHNHSHPA